MLYMVVQKKKRSYLPQIAHLVHPFWFQPDPHQPQPESEPEDNYTEYAKFTS